MKCNIATLYILSIFMYNDQYAMENNNAPDQNSCNKCWAPMQTSWWYRSYSYAGEKGAKQSEKEDSDRTWKYLITWRREDGTECPNKSEVPITLDQKVSAEETCACLFDMDPHFRTMRDDWSILQKNKYLAEALHALRHDDYEKGVVRHHIVGAVCAGADPDHEAPREPRWGRCLPEKYKSYAPALDVVHRTLPPYNDKPIGPFELVRLMLSKKYRLQKKEEAEQQFLLAKFLVQMGAKGEEARYFYRRCRDAYTPGFTRDKCIQLSRNPELIFSPEYHACCTKEEERNFLAAIAIVNDHHPLRRNISSYLSEHPVEINPNFKGDSQLAQEIEAIGPQLSSEAVKTIFRESCRGNDIAGMFTSMALGMDPTDALSQIVYSDKHCLPEYLRLVSYLLSQGVSPETKITRIR